jgi:hypothetical protein
MFYYMHHILDLYDNLFSAYTEVQSAAAKEQETS